MQEQKLTTFADSLRGKHGVESRSAILGGSERVDIIRGKDFARWFRSRAETVNLTLAKGIKE